MLRTRRYYDSFDPTLLDASVTVAIAGLVVTGSLLGVGWLVTGRVSTNIAVETPAHPSDAICEGSGGDAVTTVRAGTCAVPQTSVRLASRPTSVVGWAPVTFVGVFLVWLLAGVALHVLVGGGEVAPLPRTLAVAAWGTIPLAVEALVTLALVLAGAVTAHGAVGATLAAFVSVAGPVRLVASYGAALWQGYVWTRGLNVVHDVPLTRAAGAASVVAGVSFVLAGL